MKNEGLLKELEELERCGWDSLCDGTGGDFYGSVMTDDALMVLANGSVMTRDDVVNALGKAPPWHHYELDDLRLVPIAPDSAGLVYTGSAHRDDEGPPIVAVMSSVYCKRDGDWTLVLYQQTPADAS